MIGRKKTDDDQVVGEDQTTEEWEGRTGLLTNLGLPRCETD